jgi:hypothetical protein
MEIQDDVLMQIECEKETRFLHTWRTLTGSLRSYVVKHPEKFSSETEEGKIHELFGKIISDPRFSEKSVSGFARCKKREEMWLKRREKELRELEGRTREVWNS